MKHPSVRCECGSDTFTREHDGLTVVLTCTECGEFAAELVENTET